MRERSEGTWGVSVESLEGPRASRWQAGGGHGGARGRQAAACLLWREVADDWHLPGGLGRHSAMPGGLQVRPGELLRLSFIYVFVFYYSVVFRALIKMLRHTQKSPNCSWPLFGIFPTTNISVCDYLSI